MKDEIKEILDDLKNKNSYINDETILTFDEAKLLLDHITNLQEELKSANESIIWWTNRFKAVEKENEFLKLNNPEQNLEHFRILKENKRKIDNLRKENEHLRTQLNTLENTVIEVNKECNSLFNHLTKKDLDELKALKNKTEDEIKENIPEDVLVALGDLTNGALNYYKASKTVTIKHDIILNHIINLQEEYERLCKKILLYNLSGKIPYLNYKSKCEKALECIDNMEWEDCEDCVDQVHDILTGGDEDER